MNTFTSVWKLSSASTSDHPPATERLSFDELYAEVGFPEHYAWEERFVNGGGNGAKRPRE